MVDVSRDPRWGRVSEGSGEDAYLGSQIAKAMVRGINKMICQKTIRFYPPRETFCFVLVPQKRS
jgi:beta-glucosidase-like glycosyl hydrolase